jgi:hypothetical protein
MSNGERYVLNDTAEAPTGIELALPLPYIRTGLCRSGPTSEESEEIQSLR